MDTHFVRTKTVKTCKKMYENVFSSKTLSKVETFENETKEMQCKCRVNAENVHAENTNTANVFYQVWSTTKVGVNSENHGRKNSCSSCCYAVVIPRQQVSQAII